MTEEQLLTSAEAATLLEIKPESIRKMVSTGQLQPVTRAGRNFFHPGDVEKLKNRPRPGRPKKQQV